MAFPNQVSAPTPTDVPNVPARVSVRDIAITMAYMNRYSENMTQSNIDRTTTGIDQFITGILFAVSPTTAFGNTGIANLYYTISLTLDISPSGGIPTGGLTATLYTISQPTLPVDGDLAPAGSRVVRQGADSDRESYAMIWDGFFDPANYQRWRIGISHAGAVAYDCFANGTMAVFRMKPMIPGGYNLP